MGTGSGDRDTPGRAFEGCPPEGEPGSGEGCLLRSKVCHGEASLEVTGAWEPAPASPGRQRGDGEPLLCNLQPTAVPKTLPREKTWASYMCMAPSHPEVTLTLAIAIRASTWAPWGQGRGTGTLHLPAESWASPGCWWDVGRSPSSRAPSVCPSVCLCCLGKVKHHFLRGQVFWRGKKAICGCVVCLIKSVTGLGYTMCTL